MKKDIHPNYREVVFWDLTSDEKFLSRSCVDTKETIVSKMAKSIQFVKSRLAQSLTLSIQAKTYY